MNAVIKKAYSEEDRFSDIMKRHTPPTISIARSESDIRSFQELVYRIYCEELGWLNPESYPEKRVEDDRDNESVIILISEKEQLTGCMRIVPGTRRNFPHEDILGTRLPALPEGIPEKIRRKLVPIPRNRIAEITRTIHARKGGSTFGIEFAKILHWFGKNKGVSAFYTVIDMSGFLLSAKVGMPIAPVGIPAFCEGSWTIPGIIFTDEIEGGISRTSTSMWEYILDTGNLSEEFRQNLRHAA